MKPELPQRNVQLLQDTMAYIEQHPEEHDQESWVNTCATAFCYAGHAAILAGAQRPTIEIAHGYDFWCVDLATLQSVGGHSTESVLDVADFAAMKLGLTDVEADILFEGHNSVKMLRALVDALCAGAWVDDDEVLWIDENNCRSVGDWRAELED